MDIEFFPAANVVLIYGHEPQVIAYLRTGVMALAAERANRFAVHELPGFHSIDGCRLFASRADADLGMRRSNEPPTFECELRPISWHIIEGLLEPFSNSIHFAHCHQYLSDQAKIQLIISDRRGW